MNRPPPPPPSPRALELHRACCARGEQGYLDPVSGLFCLSSVFLAQRGECCGNGCRHCPYPPEAQAAAGRPPRPAWPHPED